MNHEFEGCQRCHHFDRSSDKFVVETTSDGSAISRKLCISCYRLESIEKFAQMLESVTRSSSNRWGPDISLIIAQYSEGTTIRCCSEKCSNEINILSTFRFFERRYHHYHAFDLERRVIVHYPAVSRKAVNVFGRSMIVLCAHCSDTSKWKYCAIDRCHNPVSFASDWICFAHEQCDNCEQRTKECHVYRYRERDIYLCDECASVCFSQIHWLLGV
jgi:hypothetical protein